MARATGREGDVVDVLTTDHREVDRAFADYENHRLSNERPANSLTRRHRTGPRRTRFWTRGSG